MRKQPTYASNDSHLDLSFAITTSSTHILNGGNLKSRQLYSTLDENFREVKAASNVPSWRKWISNKTDPYANVREQKQLETSKQRASSLLNSFSMFYQTVFLNGFLKHERTLMSFIFIDLFVDLSMVVLYVVEVNYNLDHFFDPVMDQFDTRWIHVNRSLGIFVCAIFLSCCNILSLLIKVAFVRIKIKKLGR